MLKLLDVNLERQVLGSITLNFSSLLLHLALVVFGLASFVSEKIIVRITKLFVSNI